MKSICKLLIGLSLTALPALCGTFTINNVNGPNDWYGFYWNEMGSAGTCGVGPIYPCGTIFGAVSSQPSTDGTTTILGVGPQVSSWTFDFSSPVKITVTDLNTDGDSFNVYDNSTLIFTTSTSVADGTNCFYNPATCVNDSYMSHGSYTVGAGVNVITMVDLADASGSGYGAFRLDGNVVSNSVIPEPATLSLMGLGLGGLLLGWRRKRA